MKKFISALLVVMMLVSMIPATVFAAAETFSYDFSTFTGTSTQYAAEEHTLSSDVKLQLKGCHINTQLRVYGGQTGQFAIFKADSKPISGMVVNAGNKADTLVVSGSNDGGASWTELATQAVTSTYTNYPFTFAEQYKWVKLSVKGTAQVRIKTVSLTLNPAEGACTHEGYETYEGDDAVAATCTSEGKTATVYCANCNAVVEVQTTVAKLPHSIVNGVCESCQGVAYELVTDISKLHAGSQIVIVATEKAVTMGTAADKNNRPEVALDKSEDGSFVIFGEDAQVLTIEAGTEVGTYAFNVGSGYLYAAGGTGSNHLKTKAELDALGSWTIEIDEAGIATIKAADAATTRNWIRYNDSSKIFSCYADGQKDVAIYILPVAEEPDGECDHLGYETYEGQDYVAPTCTTTGLTATVYCSNCNAVVKEQEELPVSHEGFETYTEGYVAPGCETEGATGTTYCSNCDEVVKENEVIPATGHNYVDGVCENCGEEEPKEDITNTIEEETYVFSSYTAGAQYAENEEHVLSDLVTMYTTQAHFTSQLRLYSSSTHDGYAIIKAGAPIKGITVNAGYKVDTLVVYGSNDEGATWTTVAEIAVTSTTYSDYSAAWVSTPYSWLKLDVKGTQQVRIPNMTLQFVTAAAGECTHELTEVIPGTAATCTTAGKENSLSCVCGQNVQEGAVIEALGHAYDDDCCTRCALINPEAAKQAEAIDGLPQAGDVIIFYHPNDKKAMSTAFIPGGNGGRMGAVSVTKANGMIPYSATHTAVMTVEQVGEYFRFQMNGQYLTADADGGDLMFAALPAEGETDYSLWTVTAAETYGVVITSVHAAYNGTNNQAIEYYQDKFYPYGYKDTYISSYRIQIGLISRIPAVVEMDGVQYTSFEEAYAYDPDTTIKLLADFDEINVTGDLYLDLNGHTVGSVTANAVFAGDSSATAEAAGTGKLTTTSPVETTETIGSTKYVALKDEHGVYTFHVLDLKLSAVTLRTNKAGIYYKAELACDEVLAAAIASHGVAVSLVKNPTAAFETDENAAYTQITGAPEGIFTSGSITNIFRAGLSDEKNAARGEMKIYANAYLKLEDGTVLMGSNPSAKSMQDVMTYLNENLASLEADAQENAKAFYAQWADVMASWNLQNLADAIVPAVSKEEEDQA